MPHTTQGDIVIRYGFERKGIKVSISYMGTGQAEQIGYKMVNMYREL